MTIKRRKFLQNLGLAVPMLASPLGDVFGQNIINDKALGFAAGKSFKQNFKKLNDRVWIGRSFWAVPMEDWQVNKGRLEFSGIEKSSRLHILTHVLGKGNGDFSLQADLGRLQKKENQGSVGFTVGIKDSTDPESIKAAVYFGKGVSMGVTLDGQIFIDDKKTSLPTAFDFDGFSLHLKANQTESGTALVLIATDENNRTVELNHRVSGTIDGLVALENNIFEKNESTFWWSSVELLGSKVKHEPNNGFGPVLWAMYTLSRSTLKITAQLPPIGKKDADSVALHFFKDGNWVKETEKEIDPVSFTAIFTINNWHIGQDTTYRLTYVLDKNRHTYEGTIREEPLNRELTFGGLTCQHAMGYPYRPLVENLKKSNPDMLYFSGDQLYEGNGGYPIKRQPEDTAILNYLGKWYMFGWAFGHLLKDRPTICTPDDHDVYQGNLWGEGGRSVSLENWRSRSDAQGGFVQTPKMVNVVNRTQCGHLPDAYDQTPLDSGMNTWYTQLDYGKVSFAIVSDRLFKSGPETIRSGEGRIDHLTAPANSNELDSPELSFVGNRQLDFLNAWVEDWKGTNMKVLLSQTLFANVGTHHGPKKQFLFGDLDSGGWPKSRRDEMIRTIRKACAFHINGDQHLPFMVQYSINESRDGGWTFCTPAISTGYPRWGQPDAVNVPFSDRPKHGLPNTGCYRDGFGNNNFIYAVGNPADDFDSEKNRYLRAHKKASGYGLVTFDTSARTIKMEAIRFLADLAVESEKNTYPGWPMTIKQLDNDGRRPLGYLPRLVLQRPDQLLKIINENSNELVAAIRIKGTSHVPSVYELAKYTLIVGEDADKRTLKGVEISNDPTKVISI